MQVPHVYLHTRLVRLRGCIMSYSSFSLDFFEGSPLHNAAGHNSASQLVSNFTSMMSSHLAQILVGGMDRFRLLSDLQALVPIRKQTHFKPYLPNYSSRRHQCGARNRSIILLYTITILINNTPKRHNEPPNFVR